MTRLAWHICLPGAPRGIPAPTLRAGTPRCYEMGRIDGYGAMCRRREDHRGRHAAFADGRWIVAVWPQR